MGLRTRDRKCAKIGRPYLSSITLDMTLPKDPLENCRATTENGIVCHMLRVRRLDRTELVISETNKRLTDCPFLMSFQNHAMQLPEEFPSSELSPGFDERSYR